MTKYANVVANEEENHFASEYFFDDLDTAIEDAIEYSTNNKTPVLVCNIDSDKEMEDFDEGLLSEVTNEVIEIVFDGKIFKSIMQGFMGGVWPVVDEEGNGIDIPDEEIETLRLPKRWLQEYEKEWLDDNFIIGTEEKPEFYIESSDTVLTAKSLMDKQVIKDIGNGYFEALSEWIPYIRNLVSNGDDDKYDFRSEWKY